jgi:hypothetical protein
MLVGAATSGPSDFLVDGSFARGGVRNSPFLALVLPGTFPPRAAGRAGSHRRDQHILRAASVLFETASGGHRGVAEVGAPGPSTRCSAEIRRASKLAMLVRSGVRCQLYDGPQVKDSLTSRCHSVPRGAKVRRYVLTP